MLPPLFGAGQGQANPPDPWAAAALQQQQQAAAGAQQQQQQQQPPTMYNPTTTTTPGPFLPAFSAGLEPMTQGMSGREFNIGSPLGAPQGDLEAGSSGQPPNLEQLWGVVTAIQQQVTQSQLQLATLLAALSAPAGAPPGAQPVPAQPVTAAPPGGRWQPRNLQSDFQSETAEEELRDIDKKDVAPPSKYRGDASVWRHWYTKLHTFMARRDLRWGELLEAVRRRSKDPYSDAAEKEIFTSIGVVSDSLLLKFKSQLYEYLETYTDGLTHSMVMAGGPRGSLEAFRQMCDEGFSARDRNLRKEYRTVSHPKQATFETLRRAILDWENALAQWELASGKTMAEAEKIMCLEDMCPDALQQHLETKEGLSCYAAYKPVINDYLANRARWVGKNRLNWLGVPEAGDGEGDEDTSWETEVEQVEAILGQSPALSSVTAEISAILRNKFSKTPKGKGKRGTPGGGKGGGGATGPSNPDANMEKGGGKGKGPRKCYECNEEGHIAAECPIRKARVAKGGPERLPKGKGKGKGVLQWKQWEGPLRWHPAPAGKGPGAHGLWGAPQLALAGPQPFSVLQSFFEGPNRMYANSFTTVKRSKRDNGVSGAMGVPTEEPQPAKHQAESARSVDVGNRYAALGREDTNNEELTVMLADAIKPPSRNRMKKEKKGQLCSGVKDTQCSSSSCLGCDVKEDKDSGRKKVTWKDEESKNEKKVDGEETISIAKAIKLSAQMFSKMMAGGSLMPMEQKSELQTRLGRFEVLSAIVDSGATVPVMNPRTGNRYEVVAGSANGTEYEIASGDTLEDLGEKRMAVLTAEGTLRGYGSRCAEVTKALQSVRALVASGHAVCFGLGDGSEHVIVNKETGETNAMRDDGINYLQDLLIVPPEDIDRVAAELAAVAASQDWDTTGAGDQSFGWQGR